MCERWVQSFQGNRNDEHGKLKRLLGATQYMCGRDVRLRVLGALVDMGLSLP